MECFNVHLDRKEEIYIIGVVHLALHVKRLNHNLLLFFQQFIANRIRDFPCLPGTYHCLVDKGNIFQNCNRIQNYKFCIITKWKQKNFWILWVQKVFVKHSTIYVIPESISTTHFTTQVIIISLQIYI